MHKQQGWLQAWEYCQAKLIQTCVRASQEWTEAGVSASRVTTLRRLQEKGYQATSEPETTSEASYLGCGEKELSGPKSSFQMKVHFSFHLEIKVPESGGRVERHRIHVAWSPVWSFHSQWWFGLPCHLLVLVHCVFWVHSQCSHLPGNFRALPCFLLLTSFMEMLISFSSRTWHLPTLPKVPKSWFNDHGVTVLDWPANSPDLNPIENLSGIVKRKMRDTRPNNADELKATVKETWASIPPQQCHKLITSMPRRIEAVIKAKGAPTKYWVHIQ